MSSETLYKSFVNAEKENRAALLTYTVGGDPNKSISLEIFREIAKSGVDIIECGLGHGANIGDGGAIQDSTYRALSGGIKTDDVFDIIKDFKLQKTFHISNMHLFHPNKGIYKYESPEEILLDFVEIRTKT